MTFQHYLGNTLEVRLVQYNPVLSRQKIPLKMVSTHQEIL